jgi:hypothetical protein
MPDDRRAWHRGGACLFIVNLLRRGRTTCSRENSMCRVPWCLGSAEDMRRNTLRYCALRARCALRISGTVYLFLLSPFLSIEVCGK